MELGRLPGAHGPFSLAALWAAQTLLATGLDTLLCEAPISTRDSGCHTGDQDVKGPREDSVPIKGFAFSQPFHLIVSYDWLILQGPPTPLFEGDPLVLHCQAWQGWPLSQVTFYRDGATLGPPGRNPEFSVAAAAREADSGRYHCSAVFPSPGPGSPETAPPVAVRVRELFPVPALRATSSSEPRAGAAVTLSCQTRLPLQRPAGRLLFSFHKDGGVVRGWDLSPDLQVPVASGAHAGSYWCEATTPDGRVWKQSPRLELGVRDPPSSAAPPVLSPAPQEPVAPGPLAGAPGGPPPTPPALDSDGPGPSCPLQTPDPHLYHQLGLLLRQMRDMRVLLGHLVMELRHLSARRKLQTPEGPAQYE